jgi:exodeoxyribonuclease VIII
MDFKVGIYEDLDYDTYASIPAWRSHDLTSIIKCSYSWKNSRGFSESPALLEGRLQHTLFLEHHKWEEEFIIAPEINRRTKVGKAEYEEWCLTVGDRTPIKQEMFDECMVRREVLQDFIPQPDHKVELTLCFEWNGQPCKGKLDWHTGTDVWDLKTARDASPRGFKQAINSFRYHQQAAFYIRACRAVGLPTEKFYFLAQEKAHPYPFGVYTLSDEAIAYGDEKNEQAMSIGIECRNSGVYLPFNNREGITEFGLNDLY